MRKFEGQEAGSTKEHMAFLTVLRQLPHRGKKVAPPVF